MMKRRIGIFFAFALVGLIGRPLFAQEQPPWKGNAELSYFETSGNTSSSSLALAGKVERAFAFSKLTGEIRALYGKKGEVTSDKSWMVRLKYEQNMTERTYLFVSEMAERDTLKGIEIRYNSALGLGHYFIKSATDTLKLEAGAGYIRENPIAPFPDRGYPTARLFGEYDHAFTEKTRFEQTGEYIPNLKRGEDYLINEESAFITNLMGALALKVSYSIAYDNVPPPGFKKTDRLFKTALLYTF